MGLIVEETYLTVIEINSKNHDYIVPWRVTNYQYLFNIFIITINLLSLLWDTKILCLDMGLHVLNR